MPRRRSFLVAPLLAAWIGGPLLALDPAQGVAQYGLDAWSTDHGLPQLSVTGVAQTPDGYLWVSTLDGLARFDGIRFVREELPELPGRPAPALTALATDADGGLWVGFLSGGVARVGDHAPLLVRPGDGLGAGRVWSLLPTVDGVWVATSDGLSRLQRGPDSTWRATTSAADLGQVRSLLADGEGGVLAGTQQGLFRIEGDRRQRLAGEAIGSVRTLHRDRSGDIWVGTTGDGLYRLRPSEGGGSGDITRWAPGDGLSDGFVNAVLEDGDGNLWIGTRGGLQRLREESGTLARDDRLDLGSVLSLFEDREGSLWLGTQAAGLQRLRDLRLIPVTPAEGLGSGMASTVTGSGDSLWVGTAGGGLHEVRHGEVVRRFGLGDGLPSNRVTATLATPGGGLWIGTSGSGLFRWDRPGEGSPRAVAGAPGPFVLALYLDSRQRLWVGATGGQLGRWDGERWRTWTGGDQPLGESVYAIAEHQETVWIGTDQGLFRLRDGRLRRFGREDAASSGLLVTSLLARPDGTLWIGTLGGGLNRLRQGRLRTLRRRHGLGDDTVYSMLADERGHLWLCTNRGLFQVAERELQQVADERLPRVEPRSFGTGDGMPAAECNGGTQPSAWRLDDGTLAFTTVRGLVIVDPARVQPEPTPPPVAIEGVRADGREQGLAGGAVSLRPGTRNVEIDYTALALKIPERSTFRYRLEGYDEEWTQAATRRTAYYTGVPPGDYTFRVVAANHDGAWNPEGARLSIRIRPFFYQTTWFLGLIALLVLVGLLAAHRWRVRHLARRERELERLVVDRTEALAAANAELERLASRDGLTGIANRRVLMQTLEEEWRRHGRSGQPLALVLLDLDHFKHLNDRCGHQAGDECLRRVGEVLDAEASRPADLAARYGGEELALLLPGTDACGALAKAERVRAAVEALGIPHPTSRHGCVTASVGVATTRPAGLEGPRSAAELVGRADQALYRAKQEGRNRVAAAELDRPGESIAAADGSDPRP